jgi:hypothetical protein
MHSRQKTQQANLRIERNLVCLMPDIVSRVVQLWSDTNPVAGYTGGYLPSLTTLFYETADNVDAMRRRIVDLQSETGSIPDENLRLTANAVLTSLRTQLDLPRPSGAGPSGTGMGGVYAAADGIFYIVLKGHSIEEEETNR